MKTKINKSRRRGRDAAALPSPESIGIGRAGQLASAKPPNEAGPCPAVFSAAQSRLSERSGRPYLLKFLCIKTFGFTLLEIMIASALFGLVVAGTLSVYIMCNKIWHSTSLSMQTVRESSLALSRMVYGIGTNGGLRTASMIRLNTNSEVHSHWNGIKYWETATNKPPSATDSSHYVSVLGDDPHNDSWRLTVSNQFDGVKYIDYNIQQRNILFCPDTNQTSAARQKRILICNYVSAAGVTTNASGTVGIQLTVEKRDGMFIASNTVSTSVKMRNKP